jgi:hypothetical protein
MTVKMVDPGQFALRQKTQLTDQTIHTLAFDISLAHESEHFVAHFTASILRTLHAHHAVSEKGWSIACSINF